MGDDFYPFQNEFITLGEGWTVELDNMFGIGKVKGSL